MGQKFRAVVVIAVVTLVLVIGYAGWIMRSQGNADGNYWKDTPGITFDDHGVPTIVEKDWAALLRKQGHVVASERMWQMDLIRRKASGRLSEWFGAQAFEYDQSVRTEDRIRIAEIAADNLPPEEHRSCEEYARGVNDFITGNPGQWSIEYTLLKVEPEPWRCADSLLVLIEMSDLLTSSADSEARAEVWRRHLSPAWDQFLFSSNHPWNHPLFGQRSSDHPPLPPEQEHLPLQPISGESTAGIDFVDPEPVGSNNWAWAGATGKFVANDPHLGQSVPQIWYALRLVSSPDQWVAGVSLPGIPGVIIGMNADVSWAFTNTGEDVDDYLEEKISDDGLSYLASTGDNGDVWKPIVRKEFEIKVKGENASRKVEGLFTHRGPLAKRKYLGDKFYSRQWLALRSEVLRLPVQKLFSARSLDEHSEAISNMKLPAQNVVSMDKQGNIRYRTSGTGVVRQASGRRPISAIIGEWKGIEPAESRRQLTLAYSSEAPIMMATANERIWVDEFDHNWFNDDRKARIMEFLASRTDHSLESMQELHLDTNGRFRKMLIDWVIARVDQDPEAVAKVPQRWRVWSGNSVEDAQTFAEADVIEKEMTKVFVSRVSEHLLSGDDKKEDYYWFMRRAWLLTVLVQPDDKGTAIFGVNDRELASHLVKHTFASPVVSHEKANRWGAQHPFVANVPVLGKLFAVKDIDQYGSGDLVRAEKPTFGPSMRMVWDMDNQAKSTWVFPVGQSGHVWSKQYRGFRNLWAKHGVTTVFPDREKSLFGF